jgi:bisphosphoglycerate-dependent phosphoglycerate mutase
LNGQADPYQAREYWTEVVRTASDRGKLETIPTRRATNKREYAQAKAQNHQITKKSYGGFHDNYERIQWN